MRARPRHQFPGAGIFCSASLRSRLSALHRTHKPPYPWSDTETVADPSSVTDPSSVADPSSVLPLLDLPNEIILIIAENLEDAKHVYYLLLTNRRLAHILTPVLHKLAIQDKCSISALHWAAWRGHAELAKLLIQQKGFDVNLQNPTYQNWTPLHWALCRRRRSPYVDQVVRLLLENGADVSIKDRLQVTVLHRAVEARAGDVLNLMLQNGGYSVIDAPDDTGMTALHMAAETDHDGTLWGPLLAMGADVSVRDRDGRTPLHAAVRNQNQLMARALLDKEAGINERDHRERTPLHSVFYRLNDCSMVKLLLDGGADVNLQCIDGRTPLHMAVEYDLRVILEMMLKAGANVDIKDRLGATPISILEKRAKRFEVSPRWRVLSRDRTMAKRYKEMTKLLKKYSTSRSSIPAK